MPQEFRVFQIVSGR